MFWKLQSGRDHSEFTAISAISRAISAQSLILMPTMPLEEVIESFVNHQS